MAFFLLDNFHALQFKVVKLLVKLMHTKNWVLTSITVPTIWWVVTSDSVWVLWLEFQINVFATYSSIGHILLRDAVIMNFLAL